MEVTHSLIKLAPYEIRVLGSLIEKSKTTPDYYPMTINSMMQACNQKSSRRPIVNYDEPTVLQAIESLKRKGLVSMITGGGSRTLKYKHNFDALFHFASAESAILCLLFLRGPLTPGEINSSSGRLHEFTSLESVLETLEKLMHAETPFIQLLPRMPGQKEQRYAHLFGEIPEASGEESAESPSIPPGNSLERRLETVEKELNDLKTSFEKLYKELMG